MKRGLTVIVVSGLLMSISACHKESEKDKVKKVIITVQKAAEEKDIGKIMDCLSKNYNDPQGNDINSMKGLLLAYFFQHQKIHVFIPDIEVNIEGSRARTVFQAVLTGGEKTEGVTDIFSASLGMHGFDVSLVKEPAGWKVTSARWDHLSQNQ